MTDLKAIGLALALMIPLLNSSLAQTGSAGDFDPVTIRSVISGQIESFRSGDKERAFSYAAPSIRGSFASVDQFIGMVKKSYLPVYAPKTYAFGEIRSADKDVVQKVYVTGPRGKNWIALYTLQQQADGMWKISGCFLQPDNSKGA